MRAEILSLDELDQLDLDALEMQGVDLDSAAGVVLAPDCAIAPLPFADDWLVPACPALHLAACQWHHVMLWGREYALGVVAESDGLTDEEFWEEVERQTDAALAGGPDERGEGVE